MTFHDRSILFLHIFMVINMPQMLSIEFNPKYSSYTFSTLGSLICQSNQRTGTNCCIIVYGHKPTLPNAIFPFLFRH